MRVDNRGSRAEARRPGGRFLELSSDYRYEGSLIKVVQLDMMMVWFWLHDETELVVVLSASHPLFVTA